MKAIWDVLVCIFLLMSIFGVYFNYYMYAVSSGSEEKVYLGGMFLSLMFVVFYAMWFFSMISKDQSRRC